MNKINEFNANTFIVLAPCVFGNVLQRVHHISRALSELGNKVYYISPNVRADINNKDADKKWIIKYIKSNNVNRYGINIYQSLDVYYNNKIIYNTYYDLINNIIEECSDEVVIIAYMPAFFDVISKLKGKFKVIYECVDDHSDSEYAYWTAIMDSYMEQQLMDISYAVTTTSLGLYLQRVAIEKRNNVYLLRNAVDDRDFKKDDNLIPKDLEDIKEPRIVYVGAIYQWFDSKLFYEIVKNNPDKSFVIIGIGSDKILTEKYNNLYFLGVKKHEDLKNYLRNCQVGIIPFKDNTDLIINCDPIKQYEYIACNLPVITTNMPEAIIGKINSYNVSDSNEFNEVLNKILNIQVDKEVINNFLVENSWKQRAKVIVDIVRNYKINNILNSNLALIDKELNREELKNIAQIHVLKALYISTKDSNASLNIFEEAYKLLPIRYIEKWYVYALIINNKIEQATSIVMNSTVKEKYKIQLSYCNKNNIDKIKILKYAMRIYFNVNDLGVNGNLVNQIELANYCYENGFYQQALNIYINEIKDYKKVEDPLTLYNYSEVMKLSNNYNKYKQCKKLYKDKGRVYLQEVVKIENNEITVIIPTKNRPELLKRCIQNFNNMIDDNFKLKILILDASDDKRDEVKNLINQNSTCNLIQFHKDSELIERIALVIDEISTGYCCLCADDDFLEKEGIISSIKILDNDKSIVTVKGECFNFLNNSLDNIYYFKRDSCEELIEDNPIDRLKKLSYNWVPQFIYLVYRKEDLKVIVNHIEKYNKELTPLFKEYLWYFLTVLLGKVVNIDEPLNIRDESPNSASYTIPGFYKVIKEGTFNNQYKKMKEAINNFLNNVDEKVKESIDEIMTNFLCNSWAIPKDYIKVNNGEFDLELLKKGVDIITNNSN